MQIFIQTPNGSMPARLVPDGQASGQPPNGNGCQPPTSGFRPTIHEAIDAFKQQFGSEQWFVRCLIPPSELFFIVVVDAAYYPIAKKLKLGEWMSWPVSVARVPSSVAEGERDTMCPPWN